MLKLRLGRYSLLLLLGFGFILFGLLVGPVSAQVVLSTRTTSSLASQLDLSATPQAFISLDQCNTAPFIWPSYGKRGTYIWRTTVPYTTQDGDNLHDGIDIMQVAGQENVEPIYAAHDGYLTWLSKWSFRIEVNIDPSYDVPEHHVYLYYTHMADNSGGNSYILPEYVGASQKFVKKGELLARQGRKGTSSELVHLHISVSKTASESGNIDPTKYFGDINLDAQSGGTTDGSVPPFRCKNGASKYTLGGIEGVVSDRNGFPMQKAVFMKVIVDGRNYEGWSGVGGYYSFVDLPSGRPATLKAVDDDRNSVVVGNIMVPPNSAKVVNIRLNNTCIDGSTFSAAAGLNRELSAVAQDCTPLEYPSSSSGCAQKSNGLYCGSSLGLNADTLYSCTNGSSSIAQVCGYGCVVQPAGTADFCAAPPNGGAACPNNENGMYCGSSLGLDPNTLYSCQNGTKTAVETCPLGCIQKPPGTADVCRTSTSGGSCPAGNGDYCGSTLGLDPNTLFYCANGNISVKQVCNNGCKLNPPGTPDACYPPGSGGGGGTGEKLVLYGDSNYGPASIRIQVGVGDTDEPNRGSAYKSMSLPNGWSVILSDQPLGFVGATKCFSQSQPNLENQGWAFSIESMRVFATNVCPPDPFDGIRICRETGLNNCMTVTQDIPSLGQYGFGNDTLKSLERGGSWELVLFEDDRYGGRRFTTGTISDMGGTPFGYNTSSIQVRKREPAAFELFHLGDYNGGESFRSDRTISDLSFWDSYNTPSDQRWNDNAQSIRVSQGYEIVGCLDAGFHGVCGRTKQSMGDLNSLAQGLRNGLSSIQVCVDSCPPTSVPPTLISPQDTQEFVPGVPVGFSWTGNGKQYFMEYWGGAYGTTKRDTGWRDDMLVTTLLDLPVSTAPYYWRVKSWTTVGESGWSPTYSFLVKDIAPVAVFLDAPVEAILNTDTTISALASPSNVTNLQYVWSPEPKSGQGTATAVYNWNRAGEQTVVLTVQNTGGSVASQVTVNVGCGVGRYLSQYFSNQAFNGNPVTVECVDQINFNWGESGPAGVPTTQFNGGTGLDGQLTVPTGQVAYTDNVRTKLQNSADAGQNAVCVAATTGFRNGDEILIIQSQGSGAGNYEFARITSISSCWLTLQFPLTRSYVTPNSAAQVIRVPNYSLVEVAGILTAHPWDGNTGGVVAFRASQGIKLNAGAIDVVGLGYRGGERTYGAAVTGLQGEGLNGQGVRTRNANEPGGGGGGPGTGDGGAGAGGGGYRTAGQTAKDPFYGDPGIGASVVYGDDTLASLFFGGAGGAGGTDDSGHNNQGFGGRGGNGGGIIFVETPSITGAGTFASNGQHGEDHNGSSDGEHGGGGGGAGGSVKILVGEITNDIISITSYGGAGGRAKDGNAGIGGSGQTFIKYCSKGVRDLPGTVELVPNCTKDNFSAMWSGLINFPQTGRYNFDITSDDGIRVTVDGNVLIDEWYDGIHQNQITQRIEKGVRRVAVEYYENRGQAQANLAIGLAQEPTPVLGQIPAQVVVQGEQFSPIQLNNFVTNLAELNSVSWTATSTNLVVGIVNDVATITYPANWVGEEAVIFTATNSSGVSASVTTNFEVKLAFTCPANEYEAYYFTNPDLAGEPAVKRCESQVNYLWGTGIPVAGIPADYYSVRWIKKIEVPVAGNYEFKTLTDDGVRLYVDGQVKIDQWVARPATPDLVVVPLGVGQHTIKMEYFEFGGEATAILDYKLLNNPPTIKAIPNQTITQGQTFKPVDLSAYGSDPDAGDTVYWQAFGNNQIGVTIQNNVATFTTPSSTWVGSEVITFRITDKYGANTDTKATFTVGLIKTCVEGEYKAEYFDNTTLAGTPVLVRCEGVPQYNWEQGSPHQSIGADNFSVRWTAWIRIPVSGYYKFTTVSDDGVKLYINNILLINNWTDHSLSEDTAVRYFAAGRYPLQMDYYEKWGDALAQLAIVGPGIKPQIKPIPTQLRQASGQFDNVTLATYLIDNDSNEAFTWSIAAQGKKVVAAVNNGVLTATAPVGWVGTDYVTVKVVDSFGLSTTARITYVSKVQ